MTPWKEALRKRLGDRVTFDQVERRLYGHDVASMPEMITSLFKTMPEAVVQPETVEEVQFIVELAYHHGFPLVPRGAGTSGYGGAMPSRGGVVVDLTRLNRILEVDRRAGTATVEAGVIWGNLEEALKGHGLALRLYPTSAPGATVGGWVAAGGAGVGSFEYGFIADNLLEVQVVTPDGKVREFKGEDLALVADANGITGIITRVKLPLRPYEETEVRVASFPDLESLQGCLVEVGESDVPLWHVSFSSPEFVRRREEATGESVVPAEGPLALFAYPRSRAGRVKDGLNRRVEAAGGRFLPEEVAIHEWEQRFYPMRLKRLGPSLIPSEAVIPVRSIAVVGRDAAREIRGIAIEGALAGRKEATLLAFLTGDERTLAYTIGFSKSLFMKDVAARHGGRAYAVGLFFTDEAQEALGAERYRRLVEFKRQMDPRGVMNPDKVIPSGPAATALKAAMQAARLGKPFVGLAEKVLPSQGKPSRKLPAEVANAAYACAQCGYCNNVCTLFSGVHWESASPRGKFYFLRQYQEGKVELTQEMVEKFLLCTTCKRCDPVCQVSLPIEHLWGELRGLFVQKEGFATFPGFEMMAAAFQEEHDIWAGLRSERDAWFPADVQYQEKGEVGYWAGCTASYVETDIAENAVRILKEGGVKFTYLGKDEACCGVPFLMSGKWDVWEEAVRHNVNEINRRGIKTLIASCPGCWVTLAHHYKEWAPRFGLQFNVEVRHITQVADELVRSGRLKFKRPVQKKLTWHDPCHIGRHGGIYDAPRNVLQAIPGLELVEMKHNRENALCCGSVLTRVGIPPVSDRLAELRVSEAEEVGADALVTTCPCCEVQLRVGGRHMGSSLPVQDFSGVVAEALGYKVKDSAPFMFSLWEVFEQALAMMTVDGMAAMMEELMPGMFDLMPDFMQTGMEVMKKLPEGTQGAMLKLMDRMMPVMMPRLMDQLLPKMLPQVLALMEEKIPNMPRAMRELLPKMMPRIMERVLPPMLPAVLERVKPRMTELMAERLRAKSA